MAKSNNEMARRQTNALTGDEAEKLFETNETDAEKRLAMYKKLAE